MNFSKEKNRQYNFLFLPVQILHSCTHTFHSIWQILVHIHYHQGLGYKHWLLIFVWGSLQQRKQTAKPQNNKMQYINSIACNLLLKNCILGYNLAIRVVCLSITCFFFYGNLLWGTYWCLCLAIQKYTRHLLLHIDKCHNSSSVFSWT